MVCCGCTKNTTEVNPSNAIIDKENLIIGVKVDTPPFGYYDKNGTLTGFDIDLAKLITKKTLGDENKAIFVPVNTSNRIMKLASQEVDMIIATMSVTPQREMILNFSIPYHMAGQAILVRNSSNITTLSELNNKKIALVFGSTVEKNLRTIIPNAIILGYKTYTEAFNALKEGKAEAMIADDTILLGFTLHDDSVRILPKKYTKEPYAIAFRKSDTKLKEIVDEQLKDAINSGELDKLKEKWNIN